MAMKLQWANSRMPRTVPMKGSKVVHVSRYMMGTIQEGGFTNQDSDIENLGTGASRRPTPICRGALYVVFGTPAPKPLP